ncbi:protein of unknown function [Taphrina deformans PYCC 5710]|uniref:Uncharacterized protein n=1 Tax=Taphrina deformans (strain PYCC 5710 / ATCC 11124 / CBS 356.35 / IMI 108563 / JCM 9778 / NBRC 8474) TaxID=1097556 RepID=R4XEH4_TAPDE|nr:protein of unknown function [Taphrina deformans PYCC 5710]|eukprot:CCG82876.1 protein of unknown function [Taphrina deformans PYCC 5710]
MNVVPKAPAIAPSKRQYGNGFGGSLSLYVFASLLECNKVILVATGNVGLLTVFFVFIRLYRLADPISAKPPKAPANPPRRLTGMSSDKKVDLATSNPQKRIPGLMICGSILRSKASKGLAGRFRSIDDALSKPKSAVAEQIPANEPVTKKMASREGLALVWSDIRLFRTKAA